MSTAWGTTLNITGSMLRVLHVLSQIMLISTLWGCFPFCFHFTLKEIEAQREDILLNVPACTSSKIGLVLKITLCTTPVDSSVSRSPNSFIWMSVCDMLSPKIAFQQNLTFFKVLKNHYAILYYLLPHFTSSKHTKWSPTIHIWRKALTPGTELFFLFHTAPVLLIIHYSKYDKKWLLISYM